MSHHRDSLTRLFTSLRRLSHLRGPLEWIDAPSTTTDALDQFGPLEIDIDPDTLRVHSFDLVLRLQESLPADCKWLDEATIQVDGEFPKAAGGTANVWVGIMGVRKVAIKSYRCYSSSDWLPNYVRFYKEALACSHLRHHNIVSFIGMYSTPEHPLALVFDFMDHNLGAFLGSNKNARRLELLSDIAHGVEYMHKLKVIHGDITITNVLVDPDGRARVAGLGAAYTASLIPGVDLNETFEVHDAAPELAHLQHSGSANIRPTKENDMHAFGALAYEVFAGRAPVFDENEVTGIRPKLSSRRSPRPNHPELSNRVWEMIKGCLECAPSRRRTITEVVAVLDAELNSSRL